MEINSFKQTKEENHRVISTDPVLEVDQITKTFRAGFLMRPYQVLKGVSFKVYPGEIYGLIGPNGAGKTTTLKSIVGLIFPDKGAIRIFREENLLNNAKARMGFLPENPYFYDYLTANEFLSFHAQLFGLNRNRRSQRIQDLLDLVGLSKKSGVQLRKYSKGMLQRIGLAQALINDPDFIILDEPMSGLDPVGRREFRDIILDLKRRGKTILFSSHILSDAEMLCDWLGILIDGRMVKTGRISDLVQSKIKYYEISCSGVPEEKIPAHYRIISRKDSVLLFRIPEEKDLENILSLIKTAGGRLISLASQRNSLEDEFIHEIKQMEKTEFKIRGPGA